MWERDVDLIVPLWQGGDDARLGGGAAALAARLPEVRSRVTVAVPATGSAREGGVLHRAAVASAVQAQADVLEERQPDRILTLGGDCAVEIASVRHLAGRYGERLFVLWIDAHADLNTPTGSPSGTAHGMPLRLLMDGDPSGALPARSCLSRGQVALVGTRDLDPAEIDYRRGHDLPLLPVPALTAEPTRLADLPPEEAKVYVHLDLDVLDPGALPAVAVPTPSGLSVTALSHALSAVLARHDVVGIGITEYLPEVPHDPQVIDAVLAALDVIEQ
jgi:arginase